MPSAVAHLITGASIALPFSFLLDDRVPVRPLGLALGAGLVASAADFDTAFYGLIPYEHFFGHRGFFHSPFFGAALGLGLAGVIVAVTRGLDFKAGLMVALIFMLAGASHGPLDAMTDGGMGVMLFYPFSEGRFFLPWRPFETSPIRIGALGLDRALRIALSEAPLLFGLPILALATRSALVRLLEGRKRAPEEDD